MAKDVIVRISAEDNFSTVFQKYNDALKQTSQGSSDVVNAANQQQTAFSQLGSALTGMIAAYAGMKGLQLVADMVALGDQANRTEAVFRNLTTSMGDYAGIMAGLREATGGIVSDMQLQEAASKMLQMGLADTSDSLDKLAGMAVKLGSAMGMDVNKAFSDFSLMLANQSIMRLDQFGISGAAVRQRMNELKETMPELSKEMRFMQAVMEEGQTALEKLGASADAASTPLARLQTTLQNFGQDFSQNVSAGVQGLLGIVEILSQHPELLGQTAGQVFQNIPTGLYQQGIDPNVLRQSYAEFSGTQSRMGAPSAYSVTDMLASVTAQYAAMQQEMQNSLISGASGGSGSPLSFQNIFGWKQNEVRQARQDVTEFFGSWVHGVETVTAVSRQAGALMPSGEGMNKLTESRAAQGEFSSFMGGSGVGQYTTREHADEIAAQFERIKALGDQGLLSDDDVRKAGELKDAAEKAATAFENMKLSDVFGQQSGGLAGQMTDMVVRQMKAQGKSDAEIKAYQQNADLASGRQTQSSVAFEQQIVPMLANMNPEDAAKAMMNLQNFMQRAELAGGLTPQQMQTGMQMAVGATGQGGGQQFTIGQGQTLSGVSAQTGIPVEQLLAATGASNARNVQAGTYSLGGLQGGGQMLSPEAILASLTGFGGAQPGGLTGLAADHANTGGGAKAGKGGLDAMAASMDTMKANVEEVGVGFDAMAASATVASTQMDAIATAVEKINGQELKLKLSADDPMGILPLITALSGGGLSLASLVQGNGGATPGTQTRNTPTSNAAPGKPGILAG